MGKYVWCMQFSHVWYELSQKCSIILLVNSNSKIHQEKCKLYMRSSLQTSLSLQSIETFGLFLMLLLYICRSSDPHPLESVAMGVSARTVAGISMLPFTVVKTRYEVSSLYLSFSYAVCVCIGASSHSTHN